MKSSRFVFPLFLLITLGTYWQSLQSGFVFDFLGWQKAYEAGSFSDIANCFGYRGNHQVLHFFMYSLYSMFHINGLPWFLIFCSLHAFNGWLLYTWLGQVSEHWKIRLPGMLILAVCLLFLIHPYHVEPVVWKVCIHYLLSFSAVFGILILMPKYVQEAHNKSFWLVLLIFFLSLFLLEISYVTPAVISLLLLMQGIVRKTDKAFLRRSMILGLSLWGLLAAGVLINKLTLGSWVGHHGIETHLRLDFLGMISTELKYLVKHLLDARFFSFNTKVLLFDKILSNSELTFFLLTAGISGILLYFLRIKKWSGRWHLAFFSLAASILYILPVSNLYFLHLHIGMNDRYGYLANVFLWVSVAAIISSFSRWIWIPFMSLVILLNLYFQQKTIHYWHESTDVLTALKADYRWHDRSHVFVLNSPDNYNGIWMTTYYELTSGIDELIDMQTDSSNTGIMYDVFQYNMTGPDDGVTAEQTGPMEIKVIFKQWGNWWHRHGIGASSYENEYYKADIIDHGYMLTFKQFPEGSAVIYQDGRSWKEVKLKAKSEE